MRTYPFISYLLFLLAISNGNALAQKVLAADSTPPAYRNLVLEGGGIRGIAYGGALQALDERGALDSISRVAGTSAGAIQAVLLAVGYSPNEIIEITYHTPVQRFNDGRMIFIGGMARLHSQYGWYRGEQFSRWIGELIAARTGNADLTFAELHALAGQKGYRDLYVTGTNLSRQRLEVFSHEQWPNMKLRDAVRISMSIPLYYKAVMLDSCGNVLKHKPHHNDIPPDVMIDGGVLGNYPIYIFDSTKYVAAADSPNAYYHNPQTLGLRLETSRQIHADKQGEGIAAYPIRDFRDYTSAFYTLLLESINRQQLSAADWQRSVSICVDNYGPRVRRLIRQDKDRLIRNGREAVACKFGSNAAKGEN